MAETVDVLLERLQLTIAELAVASAISPSRVEAIASGRWLASPAERASLASALGVGVDEVKWGHSMSPRNVRYHRFGLKEDFQNGDKRS